MAFCPRNIENVSGTTFFAKLSGLHPENSNLDGRSRAPLTCLASANAAAGKLPCTGKLIHLHHRASREFYPQPR